MSPRHRATAALAALGALLASAAVAHGATVSGGVTDPQGDASSALELHPFDLESFALVYDDAGALTASFSYYDVDNVEPWFSYTVRARAGVWSASRAACEVASPGGLTLTLLPYYDAPEPPLDAARYAILGFEGGAERTVEVFPSRSNRVWSFPFSDAEALAGRGYDCVSDVALVNGVGEADAAGAFCLGPQGTAACPTPEPPPPVAPVVGVEAPPVLPAPAVPTPAAPAAPAAPPPAELGARLAGAHSLAAFARGRLRVRITCRAPCRATARLTIGRSEARRLGAPRTLARGAGRLASGAGTIALRPARGVARRLQGRRRLRATLSVAAVDAQGVRRLSQAVTLRR